MEGNKTKFDNHDLARHELIPAALDDVGVEEHARAAAAAYCSMLINEWEALEEQLTMGDLMLYVGYYSDGYIAGYSAREKDNAANLEKGGARVSPRDH